LRRAKPKKPSPLLVEIRSRQTAVLENYLANPFPDPESSVDSTRCWGRAGYALAAYQLNTDLDLADAYIRSIYADYAFPNDGIFSNYACYFKIPLLWRIYLEDETNARMSDDARSDLADLMWSFINTRSRVDEANGSVWEFHDSENHDATRKSAYLLASQALMKAGSPYGPDARLDDGHDLKTHYHAWVDYWSEYFRERALEGINCEIASPTYAKYTLAAYYGIRDFVSDESLKQRATDFLTLYWADVAQDYLPSVGVRGGAGTRVYKNGYLTKGDRESIRDWLYIYDWHDNFSSVFHPITLTAASSPYSPPKIVRSQAIDRSEPYLYTSRRFGLGSRTVENGDFRSYVRFDAEGSNLLRTSYVTDDYVIGALSLDPDGEYLPMSGQNRAMSAMFASDPNNRIVIHARGLADGGRTGYFEINGVAAEGVLVVARDDRALHSAATRVFIPYGDLWSNRAEIGGWLFTHDGSAFAAIRMPDEGYVAQSVTNGKMLGQRDRWCPIVIQMGRTVDYGSFESFIDSVLDNTFSYSGGKLTYVSEAGDAIEVWSHGDALSRINGQPVNLNPDHTYSSPFLFGRYGDGIIELHHPNHKTKILDFSK
jgi:hypothetical protein